MDAKNPAKRVSSSPDGGGGACFDRAGRGTGVFVSSAQHTQGGRNQFCRHHRQSQSIGSSAGNGGTASDSDSVKSLAAQPPSEESAAVASPSASQQQKVKADATAARIEDGIEVRRALPVGASQSATPVDN